MYNLIEYSKNYSKTSGSLWNYYRDEPNSGTEGNINYFIKDSKSFDNKTSFTGKLEGSRVEKEKVKIAVPLKYFSNFWRTLDIALINCEVSLILSWSENYAITIQATRDADPGADHAVDKIKNSRKALFIITDTNLYVPVFTLSTQDDNRLSEQLKTGFKRTIKWNNNRSEMSIQTDNNNLNYLIDPTFTKSNRLFVLSFKNGGDRTSFLKYCNKC